MINMKKSKEEIGEQDTAVSSNSEEYPYGLSIGLEDDQLAKLGFSEPIEVGTVLTLKAMVTVTRCSVSQEQGRDKESYCSLQITDMELATEVERSSAQRAYPGMNP